MNRNNYHEKFELSPDKEQKLWDNSIIVFDTSALIDFYFYPKETRQEIFDKIFSTLKGRLWIPYHVQFEYLKNRKGIIEKPISEKYDPLKNDKIKALLEAKSKISKVAEQIKKDTEKSEKHPFLPQEKIDEFISFTKEIETKINQFEKDLRSEIEKQEQEIKSLNDDDTILSAFESFLEVGEELSFSKIMDIVSEGKLRYEFKIPPGYLDLKEKDGTQIFGDLIVWKQILDYSKSKSQNIIFICNDLKLDWCNKNSRSRIESPRQELIKEFYDYSNKEFWMYDQSQFLYKANEYLNVDVENARIEEISKVIDTRNSDDLIFKCGYCKHLNNVCHNELNLDFEFVGGSERSMGAENQYQSDESRHCSNCGNQVDIIFEIWEYPVGVHNCNDIEIDNGQIIQSPDFVTYFWDNYYDEPDEDLFRDR
jgi:hypothetical protein